MRNDRLSIYVISLKKSSINERYPHKEKIEGEQAILFFIHKRSFNIFSFFAMLHVLLSDVSFLSLIFPLPAMQKLFWVIG